MISTIFCQSSPDKCGWLPSALGNRPNRILLAERLDPFVMGGLLAFYEHKVAFQGFVWGINSFDQEGVQFGKKLAGQMLGFFRAQRMGERGGHFVLGEAYLRLMRRGR